MDALRSGCFLPLQRWMNGRAHAPHAAPNAPPSQALPPLANPAPDAQDRAQRQAQQQQQEALWQERLQQKAQATAYLNKQLKLGPVSVTLPAHWRAGSLQLGRGGESLAWHHGGRKEVLDLAVAVRKSYGQGLWGCLPMPWRRTKPQHAHWPVPGLRELQPCGFGFALGRDANNAAWLVQVSPQGTEMRERVPLPNLLGLARGGNALDEAGELLLGWYPSPDLAQRQLCLTDLGPHSKGLPLAIWGPAPHAEAQGTQPTLQAQLSRDGTWLCLSHGEGAAGWGTDTAELFRVHRRPTLRLARERVLEDVETAKLAPSGRFLFVQPYPPGQAHLLHRSAPASGGPSWHRHALPDVRCAQARWSPTADVLVGSQGEACLVRVMPPAPNAQADAEVIQPLSKTIALPWPVDGRQLDRELLFSEDGSRALVPLEHRHGAPGSLADKSELSRKFALLSFVAP